MYDRQLMRIYLASVNLYPDASDIKELVNVAFEEACGDVLGESAKCSSIQFFVIKIRIEAVT